MGTGLPGETIHYVIEEEPLGVHHALNLARPHVEGSRVLLYFSDNITTIELVDAVQQFRKSENAPGCGLVGRSREDHERFGVAVFDDDGVLIDIVENLRITLPLLQSAVFTFLMKHSGTGWILL